MPQYNGIQSNPFKYAHIAGAGTVAVKAVVFDSVVINTGTSAAAITFFDQTGTATTTNTIAAMTLPAAVAPPTSIPFNIDLNLGLCIVTTGATTDLTIKYR